MFQTEDELKAALIEDLGLSGSPSDYPMYDLERMAFYAGFSTPSGLNTYYKYFVNVKVYGAKGDGVTDDTAAIRAAIAAVPTNGGIVFFPTGTYKVTGNLTINTNKLILQGTNGGSQLALASSGVVFDGSTKILDQCGVSNLNLKRTGTAGPALHLKGGGAGTGVTHFNAISVEIESSTGEGLLIEGSYLATFIGCYWMGCATGIKVSAAGAIYGNSLTFIGGETQGCAVAMYLDHPVGVTFLGHAIEGNTTSGVEIPGGAYGVQFINCYFESNAGWDIKIGTTSQCYNIAIRGGYITTSTLANSIIVIRGAALAFDSIEFNGYTAPISIQEAFVGTVYGYSYNNLLGGSRTGIVALNGATQFNKTVIGREDSTPLANHYFSSTTLSFGSIPANSDIEMTVTVNGCVQGDDATAHPQSSLEAGISISSVVVTAANTVTIRLRNNTASAVATLSRTWRVHVWRS